MTYGIGPDGAAGHNRKKYHVRVDGQSYYTDLTETEREELIRKYHGFISVTEVIRTDGDSTTFDWDLLAQDIADQTWDDAHNQEDWDTGEGA
jgi:hypothetical protein